MYASRILDKSRIGLYILPRYQMKRMSEPALRASLKTIRPPNHNTMHVPTATIISTAGPSLALRPRRPNAILIDSRLCSARRRCSYSSDAKAFTTWIADNTSWISETISPSFFRTSRETFLILRV